jgi:hypothetical protein
MIVKYTIKERKSLKKKAEAVFNRWIRNRDKKCVTCGEDKKQLFAGHYCHKREDFNERNKHAQCYTCNRRKKGNMRYYTLFMIDKYGIDFVKDLLLCEKQPIVLESAAFYLKIIRDYA